MEHKMHKASRQLPEDETLELLKRGDHGILSVQGDDGYPYATPVNYIVVHDKVYLHSAPYGYKIQCLERNPKCCFPPLSAPGSSPKKSPPRMRASFSPAGRLRGGPGGEAGCIGGLCHPEAPRL